MRTIEQELIEKQSSYIKYLINWMGGEKSQRMVNYESEIAELEKQLKNDKNVNGK